MTNDDTLRPKTNVSESTCRYCCPACLLHGDCGTDLRTKLPSRSYSTCGTFAVCGCISYHLKRRTFDYLNHGSNFYFGSDVHPEASCCSDRMSGRLNVGLDLHVLRSTSQQFNLSGLLRGKAVCLAISFTTSRKHISEGRLLDDVNLIL
jgi:hypothetical protein